MKTFIALFRGINVGGNNILPMKELVDVLESLGLQNVKTYKQSGNAVFQSKTGDVKLLAQKIGSAIKKSKGFEPKILLLEASAFAQAIKSNPYPEAEANTLHLSFLYSTPPSSSLQALAEIKKANESFHLAKDVFYLQAPDGIGRSKLATSLERLLGVPATSRNWNTVCKLLAMAQAD
jgi:uncharacterized protein (DUF1697 family)